MDVKGKNPKSPQGQNFYNSVWSWRPLVIYCESLAPNLGTNYEEWHFNNAYEVTEAQALTLANILQLELDEGRTKAFEKQYIEDLKNLPDETCSICKGTGQRNDEYVKGECNKCKGSGKTRPFATYYPFEEQNIREWTLFLQNCGGFKIL